MVSSTSARPSGGRPDVPAKMTSSILPPRSDLAPCSPMTQARASTTLDLPEPFGPTTQVIPGSSCSVVDEANDLNPREGQALQVHGAPSQMADRPRPDAGEAPAVSTLPAGPGATVNPGPVGVGVSGRRRKQDPEAGDRQAEQHLTGRQQVGDLRRAPAPRAPRAARRTRPVPPAAPAAAPSVLCHTFRPSLAEESAWRPAGCSGREQPVQQAPGRPGRELAVLGRHPPGEDAVDPLVVATTAVHQRRIGEVGVTDHREQRLRQVVVDVGVDAQQHVLEQASGRRAPRTPAATAEAPGHRPRRRRGHRGRVARTRRPRPRPRRRPRRGPRAPPCRPRGSCAGRCRGTRDGAPAAA